MTDDAISRLDDAALRGYLQGHADEQGWLFGVEQIGARWRASFYTQPDIPDAPDDPDDFPTGPQIASMTTRLSAEAATEREALEALAREITT